MGRWPPTKVVRPATGTGQGGFSHVDWAPTLGVRPGFHPFTFSGFQPRTRCWIFIFDGGMTIWHRGTHLPASAWKSTGKVSTRPSLGCDEWEKELIRIMRKGGHGDGAETSIL